MTPFETLQKYNLKTDVKSIRERLYNPGNYFRELKITFPNTIDGTIKAMNTEDIVHDADLALLCELAEKGEELEEIKKIPHIQEAVLIPEANAKILVLETELREIKKRAEERRKEFVAEIENSKDTCVAEFTKLSRSIKIALIDFIFKGETK